MSHNDQVIDVLTKSYLNLYQTRRHTQSPHHPEVVLLPEALGQAAKALVTAADPMP